MDQYFTDYDIYNDADQVFKWGNSFISTESTNINEIQENVKKKIVNDLKIDKNKIRFRQFNKI